MQEPEGQDRAGEGQELAAWQGSHRGEIIDMSLGVMSLEKEEAALCCAVLTTRDKS
jgi:hypothetical protein